MSSNRSCHSYLRCGLLAPPSPCCRHVDRPPLPRQLATIGALLNPQTPDRVLYVDGTGAGKSHAMRVVGGMLGRVTLVFIPLLTLSADVLEKFKTTNNEFGEVNVSHLDEVFEISQQQYRDVLALVAEMRPCSDSTHFVFLSPQFLVKHPDAREVFLDAARRGVVGLVVIDEVHLHVQHGTSFRNDIHELRDVFF